ncbi:hypothetical protein [Paenibacillus sp. GP183]|nr:hypothetical protein [Paenibacillus sp. GP183]SEB45880.1 hypothetical protein SAMN05443246_0466 [Paenibacillus sp. GP183]
MKIIALLLVMAAFVAACFWEIFLFYYLCLVYTTIVDNLIDDEVGLLGK